jgi:hypothetical protein
VISDVGDKPNNVRFIPTSEADRPLLLIDRHIRPTLVVVGRATGEEGRPASLRVKAQFFGDVDNIDSFFQGFKVNHHTSFK